LTTMRRKSEPSQLVELMRLLDGWPIAYCARFMIPDGSIDERSLIAREAGAAIREASALLWPVGATTMRIVDLDGIEVFERLKADR
jgi:hypothetical protein